MSESAWSTLYARARTQLRSVEAEASVLLEQALAPVRVEAERVSAGPAESGGFSEAGRAELDRYERRGQVLRKASGGFQGVYPQGRRWKAGVSLGGRGKTLWLGTFATQEEAALERGRYLVEKARKERRGVLEQERALGAFMRPEINGHPAYSEWLQDQVDEHTAKVPCPFEYGVDYEVDPVTLQVTRVEDGQVVA